MNDDVTIPRTTAREWAAFIRNNCGGGRLAGLDDLADLLDPPPPSLRDEVYTAIWDAWQSAATSTIAAASARDAVLAVVRKRVLALPRHEWGVEGGWNVRLDDLVALFEEAR